MDHFFANSLDYSILDFRKTFVKGDTIPVYNNHKLVNVIQMMDITFVIIERQNMKNFCQKEQKKNKKK